VLYSRLAVPPEDATVTEDTDVEVADTDVVMVADTEEVDVHLFALK